MLLIAEFPFSWRIRFKEATDLNTEFQRVAHGRTRPASFEKISFAAVVQPNLFHKAWHLANVERLSFLYAESISAQSASVVAIRLNVCAAHL